MAPKASVPFPFGANPVPELITVIRQVLHALLMFVLI